MTVLTALHRDHVPMRDVFLPNLNARPSTSGGFVHPGYTSAPAPMGLGDFGVQDLHGHDQGLITYTRSVEGSVTLNSVAPLYLPSSSPDIFTMQLNTVLTNVDVANNSSGVYWIQNVPIYSAQNQTLGIEDNIWNFSAAGAGMPTSTLYSYGGTVVAPVFYYAVGPTWHMPTPFTIRLYNNASVFNNRPTIWFNYSITAANGTVLTGSFDRVEFNSTGNTVPTSPAPKPTFQINGKQTNAFGLLNDAELMLGGPGGGSTTTLFGINATMALWTLPNGTVTYANVPAAYSFGTDTGETSEGIAEWTNGGASPVAELGPGPSLLHPLWGLVGARSGFIREMLNVTPSNAFIFASTGKLFYANSAAWGPSAVSAPSVYLMSPGTYSFKFLLSDRAPRIVTVNASTTLNITLSGDRALGVYTPLWAWDDAQLRAISQNGGKGTVASPLVLLHNAVGPVDPLFGEFNDYYYFVFPGVFLANTDDYVSVSNAPSFPVSYSLPVEGAFSAMFGTPFSNNLQLEFYHTVHVSLVDTAQVTGWAFSQDPYMSSVLFWDSSYALVANDQFQVESTGLILFGGTHNTIWGNTFTSATAGAKTPGTILNAANQNALQLYESGDLTYNNVFDTPVTAMTPPFDLYTGAFRPWSDRWNIPPLAASGWRTIDGYNLTGNILGLSTQGGNAWSNYGSATDPFGVRPYNNGGSITSGGDYAPLLAFPIYRVVIHSVGLPIRTIWSVTIGGYTQSTNGSSLTFWEPNGTYAYSVGSITGFTAHPAVGGVVVKGTFAVAWVHWT
ncbi:MAG: thermopsin [Thermoplasmata archaeon]|nr:thermopsin [Thermoplasmata archaeon]